MSRVWLEKVSISCCVPNSIEAKLVFEAIRMVMMNLFADNDVFSWFPGVIVPQFVVAVSIWGVVGWGIWFVIHFRGNVSLTDD